MGEKVYEFITEKSLANLSTCAVLCSLLTEAFKMLLPINPIVINLFVALIISLSKLIVSEEFSRKNIVLAILNVVPIAFTSNGVYDTVKNILIV